MLKIINWTIDFLVVIFAITLNLNIIISGIIEGNEINPIEMYISLVLLIGAVNIFNRGGL